MDTDTFVVRLWGTRGSYPVPGPHTVQYGGNTPCVEVQAGKHILIIDAGTGIINLGQDLIRRSQEQDGAPIVATILFTHMHHDHTHGFPFFVPALTGGSMLHIFGPHTFEKKLEEVLHQVVLTPNFPVSLNEMPSFKLIYSIRASETLVLRDQPGDIQVCNIYHDPIETNTDDVRVHIHKSYAHPSNGVYIYRIEWHNKSVVFASDTEGYAGSDYRLIHFARNTDLLIHDAQYSNDEYTRLRQGWGHSTPQMACDVAQQCGAKRLVLFHHDPNHTDERIAELEQEAQLLFPNTAAGFEGMEIVL